MLDVKKIKSDFAIFDENPKMVYLDSAATSLTPDCVVDAMSDYYKKYRGTVHRAMYKTAIKSDFMYEQARGYVADFLNCEFEQVVFTKSTTSGLNLLALNLLKELKQGDEILVSELSHHSNLLPWRHHTSLGEVKYVKLEDNKITFENFLQSVTANTKIVAFHHISNVLGDEIPIKEISDYCNQNNITFVVDGAQAVSHHKIDVTKLGIDYYVFSGHKMCGPTGIGVVYMKKKPSFSFDFGGDMAQKVKLDSTTFRDMPVGLEGGTPSIAQVIGLGQACLYLNSIGMEQIQKHVMQLRTYLIEQLLKLDFIEIYNVKSAAPIVTFNIKDDQGKIIKAHDMLQGIFNTSEVCIRGGHMCNQLTLNLINQTSVLRASLYLYNDLADVDNFIETLTKAREADNYLDF